MLLLINWSTVFSQSVPLKNYTIDTGLPQSVIYDIFQDAHGFIWFATQDGISRFDGETFVNISIDDGLVDNMVRSITQDNRGRIFVSTDSGVSYFNSSFDLKPKTLTLLKGGGFRTIKQYKDTLYVVASVYSGIWVISENRVIERYTTENGLNSNWTYDVEIGLNSEIYAATENGFSVIENGHAKTYTTEDGLLNNRLRYIKVVSSGAAWITGYGGGFTIYKNGFFETISAKDGLPNIKINKFSFAKDGTIWAATDGMGLLKYERDNIVLYDKSKGLINTSVQSVTIDNEGNIWFGTWGSGAFMLRYTNILSYTIKDGLAENNVTNLTKDSRGWIWIGTNNEGLSIIKPDNTILNYNTNNSNLRSNRIYHITSLPNGQVYIATNRGLYAWKNGLIIEIGKQLDLGSTTIRNILWHEPDELWIGTFGSGVWKLKGDKIVQFNRSNGLLNDSVFAITPRYNGDMYIGTDSGINIVSDNKIIDTIGIKEGIINKRVSTLFEDHLHRLWVGTYKGGLSVVTPDSIYNYSTQNGLSNNLITFITEDSNNTIWIGTKRGINRFENGSFSIFNNKRGLISDETSSKSVISDGPFLWIGTVNGVNKIDIRNLKWNFLPPPVYITRFTINGRDTVYNKHLKLNHNQNYITIDFKGLNFSNPEAIKYHYELAGFEDTYRTTDKPTIQFTNLNPGDYEFIVYAENVDGIKSTQPARLFFTIGKPFWNTIPFLIFLAFSFSLIIFISFRWKSRNLKRINLRLEKLVKERTEELKRSEHLFRLISENAGDLLLVLNIKGNAIYTSPSIFNLLAYDPDLTLNRNVKIIIHKEDIAIYLDALYDITANKKTIRSVELRIRHNNGGYRMFVITLSSVYSELENQQQVVIVGHDITKFKDNEEELKKSKLQAEAANVAKSKFLASMSHELRTPLNAILGFAQILENAQNMPQKYREYVSVMHNSGDHLLSMINDILDLSKIEAGRMDIHHVNSSLMSFLKDLYNMLEIQAQKKNLSLTFETESELPDIVTLDFNKFRQILINLISNAIKYTDTGSIKVVIRALKSQKSLRVDVIDTGRGIPNKQLEQIFDAFHQVTTNPLDVSQGTGLGLTISMKLAQLMGGEITVESIVGKGSNFSLSLPYSVPLTDEQSDTSQQDTTKITGIDFAGEYRPVVLVIDDVAGNRAILTEYMQQLGLECHDFDNAIDTLKYIDEVSPDIIFTDIIMPHMSGKDLLLELRKKPNYKETPIIAVTASIFAETKEELIEFGFNDLMHKPILLRDVATILSHYLKLKFQTETIKSDKISFKKTNNEQIIAELNVLDKKLRNKLAEAVELNDSAAIEDLLNSIDTSSLLYKELKSAVNDKNFRFLFFLDEQLNDS